MKKERYTMFRKVLLKITCMTVIFACTFLFFTVQAAPPGDGWSSTPEFEDLFSGTSLDTSKWNYRTNTIDRSWWRAINQANNVRVENGCVVIDMNKVPNTSNPTEFTCGGIISKKTFGYGYYETRAKLTNQHGMHSAFWICGDWRNGVPMKNEIDGFEIDSGYEYDIKTAAHYHNQPSPIPSLPQVTHNLGFDTSQDFHVYGFEWTPTTIRYYVDGNLIRTALYQPPHIKQNMWLTGLAMDAGNGIWNTATIKFSEFRYYPKEYPSEIIVDNGETGYTESAGWINSSLTGFGDTSTRTTNSQVGNYAQWTPTITDAGYYGVYIYKPVYSNSDTNAKIDIAYNGGTDTKYIDYSAGSSGWVYLGTYKFNTGTNGYVTNTLNTAGKYARADAVRFVKEVVIDNGEAGYTESGTWNNSSLAGFNGTTTRMSNSSVGNYARWTPDITTAGDYRVYIYKVFNTNSDTNSKIDIVYTGGTDTQYIDYSTGSSGWVDLGIFNFSTGTGGYIQNTLNTAGKYARADAIRFVKQ